MSSKPDFRDLIQDCPACRARVQQEFLDGVIYTDFEALRRSIRKGNTVRVYRPFLLGGGTGSTQKQRKLWAERADAIRAKGGCLISIEPPLKGAKLAMFASVEISNVKRGRAGKPKTGRPAKEYSEKHWAVFKHHWPRRRGVTIQQALDAIRKEIAPRTVSAAWLYANVK